MRFRGIVSFSVAVAAVLVVATFASAAIIGSATLVKDPPGTPFAAPEAGLGAPWVSYQLSVSSDAGEIIQAVEANVLGTLHQRWADSDEDTVLEPTPNSTNATQGDSHLTAPANSLFGSGPAEDNTLAGSPLANTSTRYYGIGTFLQGAWALPAANVGTSANIAYIVVPKGSEPDLDIRVKLANPQGDIIGSLDGCAFFSCAPPDVPPVVDDLSYVSNTLNEVVNLQPVDLVPGTPPVSWSALAGPTYTPMFGALPGAPGANNVASWDPNTQQFSWDTTGSTRGRYVWTGTASNGAGSDGFSLTVDVTQVPEPAALSLLGLALVGFAGFRRK